MPILVSNCPRCGTEKITFDVSSFNDLPRHYDWQCRCELFAVCRNCHKATVFVASQRTGGDIYAFTDTTNIMNIKTALNDYFEVDRFISLRDQSKHLPPEFIPEEIKSVFIEGSVCLSVECWNAAGTMFRQCLDLTTKPLLPKEDVDGLNKQKRNYLGSRLSWLFDNKIIPNDLKSLASCIKEDGNDGAHDGTLKKEDAMDLLDFTTAILERFFTEPAKIELANKRRVGRRTNAS